MKISEQKFTKMVDYTLLDPNVIKRVGDFCAEAVEYNFGAVCVRPCDVEYATAIINTYNEWKGKNVKICSVVGFPWGLQDIETKIFEAKNLISKGATEIDFVINRRYLKEKNYDMLKRELSDVVANAKLSVYSKEPIIVKAILETCKLTDKEIVEACWMAEEARVDYVKTSTGLYKGATVKAVKLMHETVPNLGVKASGKIRTWKQAEKLIKAGATRLGISSPAAVKILEELIKYNDQCIRRGIAMQF